MNTVISDGIAYTSGVFLPDYMEYFGSDKGATSWAAAVLTGVYLTVGEWYLEKNIVVHIYKSKIRNCNAFAEWKGSECSVWGDSGTIIRRCEIPKALK